MFVDHMLVQSQGLKSRHGLKSTVSKAVHIGRGEVLLAVRSCLQDVINWELALQEVALLLVFWYVGNRPGSLLPSKIYAYFLPWKNITIKPVYVDDFGNGEGDKIFYGFFVWIRIDTFKGFQYHQSLGLDYAIRPMSKAKNHLLDLGNALVALALRRGIVKGYKRAEDFKYRGPRVIQFEDHALEEPVFLARSEYPSVDQKRHDIPHSSGICYRIPIFNKGETHVSRSCPFRTPKKRLQTIGLVTTDDRITYYGFRRYNLNKVMERAGVEATKKHAGHAGASKALLDSYYDPAGKIDTVGAVAGEDDFDLEDHMDTLADSR